VLFPGLEDDSSYTQRGPQGGCRWRHCWVWTSQGLFFCNHTFFFLQMSPLFFYSNYGFCNFVIFVNIHFPPVAFLMTCSWEVLRTRAMVSLWGLWQYYPSPDWDLPKMQMMKKVFLKQELPNLQEDLAPQ
jgi:hypothetical protein